MFFPHCATRFCPYDDSPFPFFYGFVNPIGHSRNKDRKYGLNKGDDYAYITRKVLFCFAVTFNI